MDENNCDDDQDDRDLLASREDQLNSNSELNNNNPNNHNSNQD